METKEFCNKSILITSYVMVVFRKHIEHNLQEKKKRLYINMNFGIVTYLGKSNSLFKVKDGNISNH